MSRRPLELSYAEVDGEGGNQFEAHDNPTTLFAQEAIPEDRIFEGSSYIIVNEYTQLHVELFNLSYVYTFWIEIAITQHRCPFSQ